MFEYQISNIDNLRGVMFCRNSLWPLRAHGVTLSSTSRAVPAAVLAGVQRRLHLCELNVFGLPFPRDILWDHRG
jgi:hypothetical protein